MLKITAIEKDSPAFKKGISKGDHILSFNGNDVDDALDFNFYASQENITLLIAGKTGPYEVKFEYPGSNGILVEDIKVRHCGNKCIFCFIDQNPKGLRKTIYVKDEDYRFSFLYGNYFTLTNITQRELDKIITMRLSPLYISVHATDDCVRKKLLGIKKDDDLLTKMKFLTDNGIELHTQAVICPGINDGEVLKKTIRDLRELYPGVRSLAAVPVGLTGHREKLTQIEPANKKSAGEIVKIISNFNKEFSNDIGTNFVFAADEFYLKAGIDLPDEDHYEGYLQYEDGIGMTRNFTERFKESLDLIPDEIKKSSSITIVTGKLFYGILEKIVIPELQKVKNLEIKLVKAVNRLFGESVTVAGLLGGNDIAEAVGKAKIKGEILLIPSTCLNFDGIFLDGMTMSELSNITGYKVIQLENPVEIFEKI
jgi:putative radical SAM enzyme (TIGR03279 family)